MLLRRFVILSIISAALGVTGGYVLLVGARTANNYQAPSGTELAPPYCAPGVRTGGAQCGEGANE